MADQRIRSRSELKRIFTNLASKGITDEMMSIAVDSLWRDKANQRTSGFKFAGSWDSVISFAENTRIFKIIPFDPLVENFVPRYSIFSWAEEAILHRIFDPLEIQIPNEEGLFCIYFDKEDDPGRSQILFYVKNPTNEQLQEIYEKKVIVTCIYWDAENQMAVLFGDERHGSEWNPQIHWYLHQAFHARRKEGLQLTGMIINGDGSQDSHAQFTVTAGIILHDDFEIERSATSTSLQILYRASGNVPRFKTTPGFGIFAGTGQISYNPASGEPIIVPDGNLCLYHIFATNEYFNTARQIISVMGTATYTKLADVYAGLPEELNTIAEYMPQQGKCYLGSIIFKCKLNYTNAVKAIIVGISEQHPPVSIEEGSKPYLSIDEKQELRFYPNSLMVQSDWNQADTDSLDYIKNKPAIPAAQIQSDWNQTNSGLLDFIKNKPTMPAAQVNADWNAVSGIARILNKPTIPAAQIQSDWNQTNSGLLDYIKNKPIIPTQINADWNAESGIARILNKPSIPNKYDEWILKLYSIVNGNYSLHVTDGREISIQESTSIDVKYSNSIISLNHKDTSTQASVSNTANTVIQSITLDDFGHVTALTSKNIDSGVTDHGLLSGLSDDDHAQYHNDARGDARYYTKTQLNTRNAGGAVHWDNVTNKPTFDNYYAWDLRTYSAIYGNKQDLIGSEFTVTFNETTAIDIQQTFSSNQAVLRIHHKDTSTQASVSNTANTVIQSITLDDFGHVTALTSKTIDAAGSDHGGLTGLADDDHAQYHNDTRGDARYYTKTQLNTSAAGGAVHWDNVTNKPTMGWNCKSISTAYGNLDNVISLGYKVVFEESTSIDIQQTFSGDTATVKMHHKDTSSQASVSNTGNTVIQSITLDTFGHITSMQSTTIDASPSGEGEYYQFLQGYFIASGSSHVIDIFSNTNVTSNTIAARVEISFDHGAPSLQHVAGYFTGVMVGGNAYNASWNILHNQKTSPTSEINGTPVVEIYDNGYYCTFRVVFNGLSNNINYHYKISITYFHKGP